MTVMSLLKPEDIAPAVKPAPGALLPAPAVAPVPAVTPSAVSQAINLSKGVDAATDSRMATNPMMTKLLDQVKLMGTDQEAMLPVVNARSAEIAKLAAQPDPERISVPRLKPLPPVPTLEEVAAKRGIKPEDYNNPMRVFGQFMPVLIALGAGLVAGNGTAAINAATAAMNAAKAGDKEAYETAHKEWLEQTKLTVDGNAQLAADYRLALEDRSASMTERLAKISTLAALNKDAVVQAAARGGYIEQLSKLIDMRDQAGKPIQNLLALTMADQQHREDLALKTAATQAELWFKMHPPLTSQDEVKAALAAKVIRGEALTPADEAAKAMLLEFSDHDRSPWGASTTPPAAPVTSPAAAPVTGLGKSRDAPARPTSRAEAQALPLGTWFVDPTGAVIQRK